MNTWCCLLQQLVLLTMSNRHREGSQSGPGNGALPAWENLETVLDGLCSQLTVPADAEEDALGNLTVCSCHVASDRKEGGARGACFTVWKMTLLVSDGSTGGC